MKRSTLEKIASVIVFFLVLMVLLSLRAHQIKRGFPADELTNIVRLNYSVAAFFITFILILLYSTFRNKHIRKHVVRLVNESRYDEALSYIENIIKNYPKIRNFKLVKMTVLAMSGRIVEFNSQYNILKMSIPKSQLSTINLYYAVLCFFSNQKCEIPDLKGGSPSQKHIEYLLLNKESIDIDTAKKHTDILISSNYWLYQSFGALYISDMYQTVGDNVNCLLYRKKALSFSQSDEIMLFINNRGMLSKQ